MLFKVYEVGMYWKNLEGGRLEKQVKKHEHISLSTGMKISEIN